MRALIIAAAILTASASYAADIYPEPKLPTQAADDTRLNAAFARCANGDTLVIPAGEYSAILPLRWTSDITVHISARDAIIRQHPTATQPILTYGGLTKRVWDCYAALPRLEGNGKTPALILQNMNRCRISCGGIRAVTTAVELVADDTAGCNHNDMTFRVISSAETGIQITTRGSGCWNQNQIHDTSTMFYTATATPIRLYEATNCARLTFRDCAFESASPIRLINSRSAATITLDHCWLEGPNYVRHAPGSLLRLRDCTDQPLENTGGGLIDYAN